MSVYYGCYLDRDGINYRFAKVHSKSVDDASDILRNNLSEGEKLLSVFSVDSNGKAKIILGNKRYHEIIENIDKSEVIELRSENEIPSEKTDSSMEGGINGASVWAEETSLKGDLLSIFFKGAGLITIAFGVLVLFAFATERGFLISFVNTFPIAMSGAVLLAIGYSLNYFERIAIAAESLARSSR